jgi:hypothetical protein
VLGGERSASLRLRAEAQRGGRAGLWAVNVELSRSSGESSLSYVIFDVEPFAAELEAKIDKILSGDIPERWPRRT